LQGTDKGYWIALDMDNQNKLPFLEAAEQIKKFSSALPGENLFQTLYGPKPNIVISCSDVYLSRNLYLAHIYPKISTADNITLHQQTHFTLRFIHSMIILIRIAKR